MKLLVKDRKRIEELEQQIQGFIQTLVSHEKARQAAEAQLEKVRGLPSRWRTIRRDSMQCADELQSILENDDE